MKVFALLAALAALPSCPTAKADDGVAEAMTCKLQQMGTVMNAQRCENSEAICFVSENGSLSCIKK